MMPILNMENTSLRQSYKDQTRRTILKAARRCFYHNGFDRTSMIDIANSATVSRATLYLHFKGKKELLHDVIGENLSEQVKRYQALLHLPEPIRDEDVRDWISAFVQMLMKETRVIGQFHVVIAQDRDALKQIVDNRIVEIHALGKRYPAFRIEDVDSDEGRRSLNECLFMLYMIESFVRYGDQGDEAMFASGIDLLAEKLAAMLRR
jgi:AcrR family transcriptional regulator